MTAQVAIYRIKCQAQNKTINPDYFITTQKKRVPDLILMAGDWMNSWELMGVKFAFGSRYLFPGAKKLYIDIFVHACIFMKLLIYFVFNASGFCRRILQLSNPHLSYPWNSPCHFNNDLYTIVNNYVIVFLPRSSENWYNEKRILNSILFKTAVLSFDVTD